MKTIATLMTITIMKNSTLVTTMLLIIATPFFWSCDDDDPEDPKTERKEVCIAPGPDAEQQIQTEMINLENGWTIILEEGTFEIGSTLSMDGKNNVTIKGAGQGRTILDFTNQTSGGEGILVSNGSNITVSDLEIRDTEGDGLKVTGTNGITIDNVFAQWTGTPSSDNGGYGLYPVLCSNVIIRNSKVRGASDSGIYVGQSENALVHDNEAYENVAGIEIENTINADVYDNNTYDNAGGILVFDLPGLTQAGVNTRVFNNTVDNNNYDNFAPAGGIVAEVPPGTGILVLATKGVEVFDNDITDNEIVGVAAFSFLSIAQLIGVPVPPGFDPFFNDVHIHDNQIVKSGGPNQNQTTIGFVLMQQFGANPMPDLLTDGIFGPDTGDSGGLCIQNNSSIYFFNLDMANGSENPSMDITPHDCSLDPLPVVNVPG